MVSRGVAISHRAGIVIEIEIEHPVEVVFYAPMPPDDIGEFFGIGLE